MSNMGDHSKFKLLYRPKTFFYWQIIQFCNIGRYKFWTIINVKYGYYLFINAWFSIFTIKLGHFVENTNTNMLQILKLNRENWINKVVFCCLFYLLLFQFFHFDCLFILLFAFQVCLVFILSIASLVIYFIDASR